MKDILGTKATVSIPELMYTLEMRDLDYLANAEGVDTIKTFYPDVSNLKVGVTSVNTRGQKLALSLKKTATQPTSSLGKNKNRGSFTGYGEG